MPFFILGYMGMPRRYYDYLPEFQIYHVIATVGSWILALGLLIMAINLLVSLRRGGKAPAVHEVLQHIACYCFRREPPDAPPLLQHL